MARLKYISRWGLMRNSIPENDAEHTLQTVMIAHALAVIGREIFHKDLDPERAALLALYHDASEVFTGDMPTPVKYFTKDLRDQYQKIEDQAREKLLRTLPHELQPSYRPFVVDMEKDPLWPLAKAADTMSAYLKCMEEIRDGNSEFKEAFKSTEEKLRALHLEEVDWFMDHFAESFRQTLDELNSNVKQELRE